MSNGLIEEALQLLSAYDEVNIVQADDTLAGLDELIQCGKVKKLAVFTGRHSADASGAWSHFLASLRCTDCAVNRFKAIPAEPDMETVAAMVEFLRHYSPDRVVALGGGSVLDAAKAAYIVYQTDWDLAKCFGSNEISKAFPGKEFKRIIAVPTTSGTGSEVTQYSNIVNRKLMVKQLISDPVLVPQAAFLRTAYTQTMPRSVTLATGLDALAHLLEGWLNVNMDENNEVVNQYYAPIGVKLIWKYLPIALQEPQNYQARKALQIASTLGGLTIRRKSTGLPHLLSFSWFGRIEHGIAAARLLPAAWRYYIGRSEVEQRTMEIASVLGGNTADEVIKNYERFLSSCQTPELNSFDELDTALLDRTAQSAGANKMKLDLAPRPVALEGSEKLLRGILFEALNR